MPPKPDHKSAAANDAQTSTTPTDTAPAKTSGPALTNDQIKAYCNELLLAHADEGGELSKVALEKWGKSRQSCHPEIAKALETTSLISSGLGLTTLTPAGWTVVIKINKDRSQVELKRKDDELEAHKTYHAKEQKVLNEIKGCEATVESKKGALQAAKADLEAAHEALAALVSGGVQTSFLDKTTDAKAPAAPAPATEWAKVLPAVNEKNVRVFPAAGMPQQKDVLAGLVQPESMKGEKRTVKSTIAFSIPFIISALWVDEKTGSSRANALPLMTKDEWQQGCEKEYGRAVDAFDQNKESAANRQKGGPWCGLVVKNGRKVYVVAPQASAVHLVHEGTKPTEKKEEPKPAKK